MPLSRELCEALFVPDLPDVWHRILQGGDAAWAQTADGWHYVHCSWNERDGLIEFLPSVGGAPLSVSGDPFIDGAVLWCPSLSDLLAIAQRHTCFGWLACGRSLCGNRSQPWECGDGDADLCGPQDCARGKTAEEAVARWLMARAKERNPHAR